MIFVGLTKAAALCECRWQSRLLLDLLIRHAISNGKK